MNHRTMEKQLDKIHEEPVEPIQSVTWISWLVVGIVMIIAMFDLLGTRKK